MKKRLITLLLCGSMALGTIPAAFAAEIAPAKAVKATTAAEEVDLSIQLLATKPSKVESATLTRTSKTSLKLTWDKVSGAKGYEVYMSTNSGSWRKVATTTKRNYKRTGLSMGSSYAFKVRAYKTSNGQKKYGNFSSVRKKTMTAYEYMVNVMEPYSKSGWYTVSGAQSFTMSGNKYYRGYYNDWYYSDSYAYFNLNGKYSKMTFIFGGYGSGSTDVDLSIEGDDCVLANISKKAHALPKSYSVNVNNVYKLKLEASDTLWGMADVKLYY
ncbi:MAG: fibronectin type III domain-containing protein [Butyricicoccus sp.]